MGKLSKPGPRRLVFVGRCRARWTTSNSWKTSPRRDVFLCFRDACSLVSMGGQEQGRFQLCCALDQGPHEESGQHVPTLPTCMGEMKGHIGSTYLTPHRYAAGLRKKTRKLCPCYYIIPSSRSSRAFLLQVLCFLGVPEGFD